MSNLSNLYISGSYRGLINLADSTNGITNQTDFELQDGLGNGIGVSVSSGSVLVENEISSSTINGIGNVSQFSQSVDSRLDQLESDTGSQDQRLDELEIASQSIQEYTSSLKQAMTMSGDDVFFTNDVTIDGTLNVYKLNVTIESSSVIFSSGSNQLGDELIDTQIFSGSVYVPNLHFLGTESVDTNTRINNKLETSDYLIDSQSFDTRINGKLDNSWTSSVFNVYTQSVADIYNSKLDNSWTSSVYLPFSTSVDARLDAQEAFSSSLDLGFTTTEQFNTYTQSTDIRITDLEEFSSSLDTNFVSEVEFANYSSSTDTTINNLSSSISTTDVNQTTRIDGLSSFTGSYATTGSNDFKGDQVISGSVQGQVNSITNVLSTASIDCSLGNFFTMECGTDTYLTATNVQPGQTIVLQVNTQLGSAITIDTGSILFPANNPYSPTPFDGIDVITFVSFGSAVLYGVSAKTFQ